MSNPKPPAFFITGSLGLDFLNTLATPEDVPVDWIEDGDGLLSWLGQAGLAPASAAKSIRGHALPGELDAVAARARDLREWFRGFTKARAGRKLTGADLRDLGPLNRLLDRDERFDRIVASADEPNGLSLESRRRWRSPESLLLPIAGAIAEFVCQDDFPFVKACEASTCTLLFVDRTPGRARRWCRMAICGNRAKQAAHRERRRLDERPIIG